MKLLPGLKKIIKKNKTIKKPLENTATFLFTSQLQTCMTEEKAVYPYFPKSETVVPPTGTALPGPYTSQMVRATCALRGKSGYFTGSFSHSFQLQRNTFY